ncbi:MAG: radical SAM protein [Candidatus Methanoperedens sp.]|nr:radical SAM protein [Candidatus Methanoperedens sp.]
MAFEGFPFIIGWELTLVCNLRCRHCGSSAGMPRVRELTLEESLAICDQFPALLVQEVNFTGGEPLLRPDWQKICSHLGELGISTKILTNGLTLGSDTVAAMKDLGIAGVGISLDGLESTHDHIRGHVGLFRCALAGIKRVQNADIPITVITTVNALNLTELPSMFTLLRSMGINRWQIQPISPQGRAHKYAELHLTEEAYMQLGTFVKQWEPLAEEIGLKIRPSDNFGYFTEMDTREPPWRGCSAGLFSCGITSDGKIKGCISLPDEIIEGDLRQHDLWDIWFHPDSFAYTRQFSIKKLGSACHSCDKAEQCHGGCSAMSYGSRGSFHDNPYCFYGIKMKSLR